MAQEGTIGIRGRRVSLLRSVLFSLLMAVLIAAELYGYYAVFPDFLSWLKEIDHKSCAWIGGQLSFMLPFITICVFQTGVYRKDENGDGMCQLEKAWEILLVSVLVYGALLPHIISVSNTLHDAAVAEALLTGKKVASYTDGGDKTLFLAVAQWFLRLTVPLMLLGTYHATRGCRERREYTVETAAVSTAEAGAVPAPATGNAADGETSCAVPNETAAENTAANTEKETENHAR